MTHEPWSRTRYVVSILQKIEGNSKEPSTTQKNVGILSKERSHEARSINEDLIDKAKRH